MTQKKKLDVKSKLMGREWRILSEDSSVSGKYIFLKNEKLLISLNGVSTYTQWQLATESSIILDEGIATFLYQVVHIDDELVVLNLDGTQNFCILVNACSSLGQGTLENVQWYLYRNCGIDILTKEQKRSEKYKPITLGNNQATDSEVDWVIFTVLVIIFVVIFIFMIAAYANSYN